MAPNGAWAIPPEGLEAHSQTGPRGHGPSLLYVNAGYDNPSWTTDYETLDSYMSLVTGNGNIFTYGGSTTAGNLFGDRDVYFGRYDLTFSAQSLSFKAAHEDLRYLNAGKNIFSLDYNANLTLGREAQFYLLVGIYYRFNLNRWNQPSWNPVNFNTEDRDTFLEFCFGSRIKLGQENYWTIDVNNRDPFLPFNGDNIALDLTVNLVTNRNLTWRITESSRFSGLLAGTADLGEEIVKIGFITGF